MKEDYRKYGVMGSIVFHAVVLLLLIFFGMKAMEQEEEGLLVNFGDSQTGFGVEEPMEAQAPPKVEPTTPPPPAETKPAKSSPDKEAVNTQDFEEAAALKEAKKKKETEDKAKRDEENRIKAEQTRIAREEAERKRKAEEAERKRQEELTRKAAETQSRVKNAFGGKGTGSGTSEGDTKGDGNQGHVTGDPNSTNRTGSGLGSKGSGYSLTGRSLMGTLPKPEYNIQEEGIVVVEITVDKNGVVTSANPILRGTTTQNAYLWKVAKEAALRAKFNSDPNAAASQRGTITYHFILSGN